jgi:hypothetical protein
MRAHLIYTHFCFALRSSRVYENTIIIPEAFSLLFLDIESLLSRKCVVAVNAPLRCSTLVDLNSPILPA